MFMTSLLVLHRYLGVVLGLLMTLWCLSGFVMMYQGFPGVTGAEREAGLERLDVAGCCALDALPIPDDAAADRYRVEMLNGEAVLRMPAGRGQDVYRLSDGMRLGELDEAGVRAVAQRFVDARPSRGEIVSAEVIRVDQWTPAIWKSEAPMWKVVFDDREATWVYVSGAKGQVVQDASGRERLLSWFGAIPHWLYPTLLRQDGPLWTQVVIWSAALGTFLTVTGLVVGFVKLRSKSGRLFPYRRFMWFWHHVLGVFAGALVLTWTFSGLLTMSPWGLFESEPEITRADVSGSATWGEAKPVLAAALASVGAAEAVTIRSSTLFGEPHVVIKSRDGSEVRHGLRGPAPLSPDVVRAAIASSDGALAGARLDVLEMEDAYYYGHKTPVELPVLRLTFADKDATLAYLDTDTGEVARLVDGTSKRYRWLESGFHSFDWPVIRNRPLWDAVVLLLMAAVTLACATGAWMSFTRIGRDFGRMRDWLKGLGAKAGQ